RPSACSIIAPCPPQADRQPQPAVCLFFAGGSRTLPVCGGKQVYKAGGSRTLLHLPFDSKGRARHNGCALKKNLAPQGRAPSGKRRKHGPCMTNRGSQGEEQLSSRAECPA